MSITALAGIDPAMAEANLERHARWVRKAVTGWMLNPWQLKATELTEALMTCKFLRPSWTEEAIRAHSVLLASVRGELLETAGGDEQLARLLNAVSEFLEEAGYKWEEGAWRDACQEFRLASESGDDDGQT